MFKKIIDWVAGLFRNPSGDKRTVTPKVQTSPPIHFKAIDIVDKPPKNIDVKAGHLYCVISSEKMKWSIFECPCGCGGVVTLSLQAIHSPFWKLLKMESGRPTLHPSIWRDKGCMSHFWIKDGRVFWCTDTGSHPDSRSIN